MMKMSWSRELRGKGDRRWPSLAWSGTNWLTDSSSSENFLVSFLSLVDEREFSLTLLGVKEWMMSVARERDVLDSSLFSSSLLLWSLPSLKRDPVSEWVVTPSSTYLLNADLVNVHFLELTIFQQMQKLRWKKNLKENQAQWSETAAENFSHNWCQREQVKSRTETKCEFSI